MVDPNAAPESLELRELRGLRSDVAALTTALNRVVDRLVALERADDKLVATVELVRVEQVRLGQALGLRPSQPPPLRAVGGSVPPDHGDHGRRRDDAP